MENQPQNGGLEQDIDRAHETALQMNPNASLATEFRKNAQTLAGEENPAQSENPIVRQWMQMAETQDQLARDAGEKAVDSYDQRKALILQKTQDLIMQVAEKSVALQRGELKDAVTFHINPPISEAEGMGVSAEDFSREYKNYIYQSLRIDPAEVQSNRERLTEAPGNLARIQTIMPDVSYCVGRKGITSDEVVEWIDIRKIQ